MLHGHEAPQRRLVEKTNKQTKPYNMNFIHLLLLYKNNINNSFGICWIDATYVL